MVPALLLSLAFLLLWWLGRDVICGTWSAMLEFWQGVLGLGGGVSRVDYLLFDIIPFCIPMPSVGAGLPSSFNWGIGMLLVLVLVILSFVIPRRYLPVAYVLRITAFFQATAQVFFYFWPLAFPYEAAGYIHGMLIASWMFIAIVPLVLGFTYYFFDFSLWRKLGLTILIMGHQVLLVPMQYVMQALVMHHQTLLFMPLMFFVFGLPLNVLIFIAFFGWGFSWECRLYDENVQWKVRHRGF
jgi:hypothetical protein